MAGIDCIENSIIYINHENQKYFIVNVTEECYIDNIQLSLFNCVSFVTDNAGYVLSL